ncbi:MAG: PqqD family protein [Candidatus Competibacteraceae bacterium]|nr:PqqD family protein [Candidatus Competibacteraceae bacterium]
MSDALSQRVSLSPQVLFQALDGEAVLLDLDSEQYFGLDEVGTRIWQLLQDSANLDTAYQTLLTEYDISAAQLRSDLLNFVGNLNEAGLITVSDGDHPEKPDH